ncbi:MAG: caspase family protein [Oscillatoriophycideae cyanobacterium NC_groundwater_1537_Pr4_S-0.65um_50_18]|nr:caspase family protein [Oscillatoriophycideae cyanobacterium NC_groundwater_1537_Pr4_S-0.65um_50_18]
MGLTRRTFIQAGLALTTLGCSELGLSQWADRYQQAIALPTRRKLALLIGINQYSEPVCDYSLAKGSALNGCLTDVALQQELLTHRFGFQPSDILTLTDQEATQQAIFDAFQAHLIQQSRPGDVVVFHFSGLGSRILLEEDTISEPSGDMTSQQSSLVPIDGWLPTPENPVIHDVSQATLGWLLRSLPTDQVTTVLDTSYLSWGRTLQGNLRVRSRPNRPSGRLNDAEALLQAQLSRKTDLSRAQIQSQWRSGQLPGLLLSATQVDRMATEAQWSGFSAGLFTYALTQQLWWATPATTLYFSFDPLSFNQVSSTVRQAAGVEQQPVLSGASALTSQPQAEQKTGQKRDRPNAGLLKEAEATNADGVIHAVEEEGKAQLWLTGLPAAVLENYGTSVVAACPAQAGSAAAPAPASHNPVLLQIRSREGLLFKARLVSEVSQTEQLRVGQWVQEQVRFLPRNVGLNVAIDASLKRIERVDATSAFSAIPKVSSVIAGEQSADFLFGKNQPARLLTASLDLAATASQSGYGLFSPGRDAIPSTLIQEDEAVKTAVNRVAPALKTLLATKLLRLTENRGSSRLRVSATLEQVSVETAGAEGVRSQVLKPQILMQQETVRGSLLSPLGATAQPSARLLTSSKAGSNAAGSNAVELAVGNQIQYRLKNGGDRPVYFVLLGLDASGNAIALYPGMGDIVAQTFLAPGETLTVPPAPSDWKMQTAGLMETHIVFCPVPLLQTYQTLATTPSKTTAQVAQLPNALDVVQALLQDLHQASLPLLTALGSKVEIPTDTYTLEVNAWATLSFVHLVT